jgi:hypothetical protein
MDVGRYVLPALALLIVGMLIYVGVNWIMNDRDPQPVPRRKPVKRQDLPRRRPPGSRG